jgi:large subunit ribosomal protein L4
MAAPKAPMLGAKKQDVSLDAAVFGADVKPHLVHEAVRAELAADRSATRAVKTRGMVSGGRSKPWRQKGTGRARAGTNRAVHWTGGSVAFDVRTNFEVKLNRKERRAALRAALTDHARRGSLAVVDPKPFDEPSTRQAAQVLADWGEEQPTLVVVAPDETNVAKSFRNIDRVQVVAPGALEVAQVVWARSLLVTEAALPLVQGRAS